MLRNLVIMLLAVLLGLGLSQLYNKAPSAGAPAAEPTQTYAPAPDFAFTTLEGTSARLHDFAGKAVLLNFWASWCVPCRVEFPQLIALAASRQKDLVVLALSVDHDTAAMEKFLAEYPQLERLPNFLIVHDRDKAITQDVFQVIRYPESILVGPDMTMRRKYLGIELAWDGPEFAVELNRVLTGR